MIDNRRILAVKMDSELFDEMKKQLKEMECIWRLD